MLFCQLKSSTALLLEHKLIFKPEEQQQKIF